jgi:hypothetical protein
MKLDVRVGSLAEQHESMGSVPRDGVARVAVRTKRAVSSLRAQSPQAERPSRFHLPELWQSLDPGRLRAKPLLRTNE